MPICKKCDSKFPSKKEIKGKVRVLSSRKYCLKCSPFGEHNTRDPSRKRTGIKCRSCDRKYDYDRAKGHTKSLCNSCSVNNRRFERKKKAVALLGGKCIRIRCGYNKTMEALCFHHRNPRFKKFGISGSHCRKWSEVKKELKKCDLLCLNCHAEIHGPVAQR